MKLTHLLPATLCFERCLPSYSVVRQYGMSNAFLYASTATLIFMEPPKGLDAPVSHFVNYS